MGDRVSPDGTQDRESDGEGQQDRGHCALSWIIPIAATLVTVVLCFRRSTSELVFSRWSSRATLVNLSFVVLTLILWWIQMRPVRRRHFCNTMSSMSLRSWTWLGGVFALLLGGAYYFGGRADSALALAPLLSIVAALCMSTAQPGKTCALFTLASLSLFVPIEGSLAWLRNSPRLASIPVLQGLAQTLDNMDSNLIQYVPGAMRFDPELGYLLQPSSETVFRNAEFETSIQSNSLGLRDTENALTEPEIIVIGDSFAMGWGVEHAETFPALVGNKTGLRVLNTAISSYGTARQLILLQRADLSRAKYLVIQYCSNDYAENLAFTENGNRLETMSEATFNSAVFQHALKNRYYPFRYTLQCLSLEKRIVSVANAVSPSPLFIERAAESKRTLEAPIEKQVDIFLNVLRHSPVDLSQLQIVVLQLNPWNARDEFIPTLSAAAKSPSNPAHIRKLKTIDIGPKLGPESLFVLDTHINAKGHEVVAAALDTAIVAE